MTNRWYSLAIVAVLSMNQALGSSFDRRFETIFQRSERLAAQAAEEKFKENIKRTALLAYDKGKQAYGHLKSYWREYTIAGLGVCVGVLCYWNLQLGRQMAQLRQGNEARDARLTAIEAAGDAVLPHVRAQGQQIAEFEWATQDAHNWLYRSHVNLASVVGHNAGVVNQLQTGLTELQEAYNGRVDAVDATVHSLNILWQDHISLRGVVNTNADVLRQVTTGAEATRQALATHLDAL